MRWSTRLLSLVTVFVISCGGSQPPPEPPPPKPAAPEPEPEAEPEPAAEEPEAEPEEEGYDFSSAEKGKREYSPKEVVAAKDVLFTFHFQSSEAYEPAEQKCDEKSGGDPKKRGECMRKVTAQFEVDSMTFKKEGEDKWVWLSIQRRGKSLKALHKVEFEWGEETDTSVTIKPKGRDKGSKPWGSVPSEVVINVPSRSEIVIDDPTHGKMVYVAKHGLMGEQ